MKLITIYHGQKFLQATSTTAIAERWTQKKKHKEIDDDTRDELTLTPAKSIANLLSKYTM